MTQTQPITSQYLTAERDGIARVAAAKGKTPEALQHDVTLFVAAQDPAYPPPVTPPATTVRRGTRMGISVGPTASLAELDGIAALGLGWVRVSHEYGWIGTVDALAKTVQAAKDRGLKVLQCGQISGKRYDDPTKVASFCDTFSVQCADAGIAAWEGPNECNHGQFWVAPRNADGTVPGYGASVPKPQATIHARTAQAIRAKHPSLTLVTGGTSPEVIDLAPHIFTREMWDANATTFAAQKWTGWGVHPFCYPEDPRKNGYDSAGNLVHPEWNPMAAVPIIAQQAKDRGVPEVWLTEFGAPGIADLTLARTLAVRGYDLTEDRQRIVFEGYRDMIRRHEQAGVRVRGMMIATLFDGESATNSREQYLGLIRKDGTRKPAWSVVRDMANELVPA